MTDSINNKMVLSTDAALKLLDKGSLDDADLEKIAGSDLSKLPVDILEKLLAAAKAMQANTGVGNGNSPSGVGPALIAPNAELNMASLSDLSTILGLLDSKTNAANSSVSMSLIKNNSNMRKDHLQKIMKNIDEQIKKQQEAENKSTLQKVLGYISKGLGLISAIGTIVAGFCTGGVPLILSGVVMLFSQVDQWVAQETNKGIGLVGRLAQLFGASDETAQTITSVFDTVLTVAAGVASSFSLASLADGKVKLVVGIVTGIVNGGAAVNSGVSAFFGYQKAELDADVMNLQADMAKEQGKKAVFDGLQQDMIEALRHIYEEANDMREKVKNIIDGNQQTVQDILTNNPARA